MKPNVITVEINLESLPFGYKYVNYFTPNLTPEIIQQIADIIGIPFEEDPPELEGPGEKEMPKKPAVLTNEHPGYQTANALTYRFTKEFKDKLRKNQTEAEKVLWGKLRNKKTGYKIRRQHIIDDFIADFVCLSKKLVIEIDGKIHLKQKEYDEYRTARLNDLGFEVIRFTNEEVFVDADKVTANIKNKLDTIDIVHHAEDIAPPNLPKGEASEFTKLNGESNPPPLEGLGEVEKPDIVHQVKDLVPLHLPKEETSTSRNEEIPHYLSSPLTELNAQSNPTPLEGPGKVEKPDIVHQANDLVPLHLPKEETSTSRDVKNPHYLNTTFTKLNGESNPPPLEGQGEAKKSSKTFSHHDISDYVYAFLLSPTYRVSFKALPENDFLTVPFPKDKGSFWKWVELGGKLRTIHHLENLRINDLIPEFPIQGDNVVRQVRFEENYEIISGEKIINVYPAYPFGRVYINENQFFQGVPLDAWELFLGGFQPALKWLQDRQGQTLLVEDILLYQKIIVALFETIQIMKEMGEVD